VRGGDYTFSTGGAGSTTLVFQTVLLPLLLLSRVPSTLRLEGGTHNPMAPPLDFLRLAFLPLLARMGARVDLSFERHGFYPAGGGAWSVTIHPVARLTRLELLDRGDVRSREAVALVAQVRPQVAVRELDVVASELGWDRARWHPSVVKDSHGPGNVVYATIESANVTEVCTAFGERGVSAERVAASVVTEVARYLAAGVPVGEHLADQLLLPMAFSAGGSFRTVRPSEHCRTQMALLEMFVGTTIAATEENSDVWRIDVPARLQAC
jgi:RNA 3'-terminal phosphate cyclase (ATP)